MSAPVKAPGTVEQRVDDDLGHRVAGSDQAVHLAAGRRALADGEDVRRRTVRHCSSTRTPPRSATLEAALAGQGVARPDAGGEDDDLGVDGLGRVPSSVPAGRSRSPVTPSPPVDLLGHHAGVDADAELLDVAHQRGAAGAVELHRHQPRRHLDDVGLEPELDERVGRLQTEQAAADHDAAGRALAGRPDRLEVLDGAVDEAAVLAAALDRRHERRRAGGQDERRRSGAVDGAGVGQGFRPWPPCGRHEGDDRPTRSIPVTATSSDSAHARVVVLPLRQQRQLVGALDGEEARQRDPVVGRARLLAEHDDVVGLGEAALDGGLDEAVADHAVADDNEGGTRVGHAEDGRKALLSAAFRHVSGRKTLAHGAHGCASTT